MSDSYSVDTDALRGLAKSLDGRASETENLVGKTKTAEVPTGSWGELGASLGLSELYSGVRDQADATLSRIRDFLQWTAQNLADTAGRYDDHEETTASTFRSLGGGTAA